MGLSEDDIDVVPVADLLAALQRRNLTYIIALIDHNELAKWFTDKHEAVKDPWYVQSYGPEPLLEVLGKKIEKHLEANIKEDVGVEVELEEDEDEDA